MIVNPLHEHSWAFPLLEWIHIAGIAGGVGTIAVMNLRLLGLALTQNSAARLWNDLMPWTAGGLTVAIFSGLGLFSIDPEMYFSSDIFRVKMLVLVAAMVFHYTMVRRAAAAKVERGKGCAVAWVSLTLWAMVPAGGIFLGFFDAGGI